VNENAGGSSDLSHDRIPAYRNPGRGADVQFGGSKASSHYRIWHGLGRDDGMLAHITSHLKRLASSTSQD
jgi:hypothetical protein